MNRSTNVPTGIRLFAISIVAVCVFFVTSRSCYPAGPEDLVLATVNNVPIYRSELDRLAQEYKKKSRKQEVSYEEKKQLLKNLIGRCLLSQHDRVCAYRKDPVIAKKVKAFEDDLVIARFLEVEIGSRIEVSEDELKRHYQENRKRFFAPPKVKASHILLRTEDEAEEVLVKLRGGEEFERLAKAYSIDLPMALEGGSMGIIEKGRTLPALESAVFALKKNEISDVVKTEFGYHIIRVDEIISGGVKSYEEVKDGIKAALMQEKESKALTELAAKLEAGASVNIFEAGLREVSHE
jgi:peptidyl-prolyl cis-trans isomerase C